MTNSRGLGDRAGNENTGLLAHFEGPFTEDELRTINHALDAAENARNKPNRLPYMGKPWIVTSIEGAEMGRMLLAHRLGATKPLVARSVDGLVERIRTCSDERRPRERE